MLTPEWSISVAQSRGEATRCRAGSVQGGERDKKRGLCTGRAGGVPTRAGLPPGATIPGFDPLGEVSIVRLQEESTSSSLGAEPRFCRSLPVRHDHLEPQSPLPPNGNNASLTRGLEEFSKSKLLVQHSLPKHYEDVFYRRGPRWEAISESNLTPSFTEETRGTATEGVQAPGEPEQQQTPTSQRPASGFSLDILTTRGAGPHSLQLPQNIPSGRFFPCSRLPC